MEIIRYPSAEVVNAAVVGDEPLIAAVSHSGDLAVVAPIAEAGEHSVLLMLAGRRDRDIDDFFRICFDAASADWNFTCPPKYSSSSGTGVSAYYADGLNRIPEFLVTFGYFAKLNIKNAPPEIWDF